MKKTKIICTVGPASEDRQILRSMMLNGMNGARLNFSHGTQEGQKRKIDLIKELREELNLPIPIILDTKGPEIRTGRFAEKEVLLTEGQKYILTTEDVLGTSEMCSVSYKGLIEDVKPGNKVLIDDGLVGMTIDEITGSRIICTVNNSGIIKDYKSVNIPGVRVKLPAITDKDKDDILFGIGEQIDFIAQSFVRESADVKEMRAFLEENGAEHVKIIAKIENKEGVDNISDIIQAADGIMVARGDLGVEIPAEQVPLIQKKIIKLCNFAGKPVITATQMMDSMIRNPRPTRAEAADVANAIFDGTDVIMLSGETASGRYPEESVRTMNDIAITTETAINYDKLLGEKSTAKDDSITDAIGYATCTSAQGLKAAAIITPTTTGHTAKVVAKFRPKAPIFAFTRYDQVARQLSLVWGVTPVVFGAALTEIDVFREAVNVSIEKEFVNDKDLIVITAGAPVGIGGMTNMLRIHIVGNKI